MSLLSNMISDRDRVEIQANTLFTHDEAGRMDRVNEPDGDPAPRFFLARSTAGHAYRFSRHLPNDVVRELMAYIEREPVPQDLRQPPAYLETYKAILAAHAPIQKVFHGPAYYFPPVIPMRDDVAATQMTAQHAEALQFGFGWVVPHLAQMPPVFAVLDGARAVALCFSSRVPTQRSIDTNEAAHEAGAETLRSFRGRGYAAVAVAGWATAIRALGHTPLYSTEWTNLASQAVAKKLNLILYGDDLSIR